MNLLDERIELSDEVFRLLRDMVYDMAGIYFSDDSKFIVESRLQLSVKRKQFDNFRDYYYFLKYDRKKEEELTSMIDIITIHETYFFRERQQLETFNDEIIPELVEMEAKEKKLRIWSAGCSTGEEAYTLSMILLENPLIRVLTNKIYGSDISQNVLQSARRGIYQDASFRSIDPYYHKKYFTKEANGYKINDQVKKNVTFLHLILFDSAKCFFMSRLTAIFCRNLILYIDQPA